MKSVFDVNHTQEVIARINSLKPETQGLWGKMDVAQMLAHCNVTYEKVYENKHPKPNFFMGFILKVFVEKMVINEKPYKKNSGTAPAFVITDEKVFEAEKNRLRQHINKTYELGEAYFDEKESLSFGKLSKTGWNNMFAKHLNHHITQFGVQT